MGNIGSQFTEAFAGLDRTEEIMSMDPEEDEKIRTTTIDQINGDITFKNVSFSYEEGNEVIHNISFHAKKGSMTALVGTSGSGKSTIAGLAASFLNPKSGKITIDGIDLSTVKLSSYRKKLGVVLSNLDNESESLIQESLKKLMNGRTTFVIAHRLSTIRQADQILVIEEGTIVEEGTHNKLLAKKGRYYNLHKYQARI